jgi:hypothetical protein
MILVDWVLGVPLLLHQTAETQYSQPSLLVEVEVADRGNQVHQVQWTTEELVDALDHRVAADQTLATVWIVVSVITADEVLMVKDIQAAQVLDLMQILKTLTKAVAVVEPVVREQVRPMVVNAIVHLLEAIKLREAPVAQQIY